MANNKYVYQQVNNVSIPKMKLDVIASDENLGKTDLRVLLELFTKLDGFAPNSRAVDPANFNSVDCLFIADRIGSSKKKVKLSLEHLVELGYIEKGSSNTVKSGYRFTF